MKLNLQELMVNVYVDRLRNIGKMNSKGYKGEIYMDFDHFILSFDWVIV